MNNSQHKEQRTNQLLLQSGEGYYYFSRNPQVDFTIDLATKEMMQIIKAQEGNLYYFDEEKNLQAFYPEWDNPESRRIANHCIKKGISLHLEEGNAESIPEIGERKDSYLCSYLGLREGDIGAFILSRPRFFGRFFETDFVLLKGFAATFSILLRNARIDEAHSDVQINLKSGVLLLLENAYLSQNIKEFSQQMKSILEVSNIINSSKELNDLIQSVLYSARRVMKAESASLFLVDEKTGDLYFDLLSEDEESNLEGVRVPQGKGIVGLAAKEQRSVIVNDAQNDPRIYRETEELSKIKTRNLLASPLLINGKTIGVIEVMNTIDRSNFNDHDLDMFESFSDSVAIAIQRRSLLDDLQVSNIQLERKLMEVTSLHTVTAALVETSSIDDLFKKILRIIIKDLKVSRASILIQDKKNGQLEIACSEGRLIDSDFIVSEHKLATRIFGENKPVAISDILKHPEYSVYANFHHYVNHSCILIPLSSSDKIPFGVMCVTDPDSGTLTDEDFILLQTIASQLVRGYENILLSEESMEKKAIEKELEITSKIQNNILPDSIPEHRHVDLASRSVMARTTGGDFYDYYVHSPHGEITMLVADVSGKSLPAALFMAVSSSILRTIVRSEKEPTKILSRANELLYEESQSGMFVTVFLCRYEPAQGKLRFASAGHNEMILMHADGAYELLSCHGTPLGTLPGHKIKYTGGERVIERDDMLVLYTDGVVEAINASMEEYGMNRLIELLRENRHLTSEEILESVYRSVLDFSESFIQYDDFTMVISKFHGTIREAKNYVVTLPATIESIPLLRDYILQIAQSHGLSGHYLEDILLATDEAATNIITHAYKQEKSKRLAFKTKIHINSEKIIRITFSDEGLPFRIEEVRAPSLSENLLGRRTGGFGVYLIRSLMDNVKYYREGNKNYLVLEKKLSQI